MIGAGVVGGGWGVVHGVVWVWLCGAAARTGRRIAAAKKLKAAK
jgi:hypothetical protein